MSKPLSAQLARLLWAGELTAVWVPVAARETIRDLLHSRDAAVGDPRLKRQAISSMLLRPGAVVPGQEGLGATYRHWLEKQRFEHLAHGLVLQKCCSPLGPRRSG
jgi:hypothetical protein